MPGERLVYGTTYTGKSEGWYVLINGRCDTTLRFNTEEETLKHITFLREVNDSKERNNGRGIK